MVINSDHGNATCLSCGARYSAAVLSHQQIDVLRHRHTLESLLQELQTLREVTEFFGRHPRLIPAEAHLHFADDPRIFCEACGIDPGELRATKPLPSNPPEVDREKLEFMRRHAYSLGPRMSWLAERIDELEHKRCVECPNCHKGTLTVAPEDWDEFNRFDAVTFLWIGWHEFAADGSLHIKTSGSLAGEHWTGMKIVAPSDADFPFLSWLVGQQKFDRLVESKELATLRTKWEQRP